MTCYTNVPRHIKNLGNIFVWIYAIQMKHGRKSSGKREREKTIGFKPECVRASFKPLMRLLDFMENKPGNGFEMKTIFYFQCVK